ncbi:MAG: 4Fe-4S binding protein [Anaerolineales bacterium]|nr:4Fe-4S binding protein [Anaerolineales bacterium]
MTAEAPYQALAERLHSLPNGFPATRSGVERRLLAMLFTPDQAALAAQLRLTKETAGEIARRLDRDPGETRALLKSMARAGCIAAERSDAGIVYGLMPFVVGIYEMQVSRMETELARLFEDYYQETFGTALAYEPSFHRVIPVQESVHFENQIQPFEHVSTILESARSWGVMDCICRKQKALIGDPCDHPVDVCMVLGSVPNAFDKNETIRGLTLEQAREALRFAAEAGLVHCVSNNQKGIHYICNCCTCSCGILRGIADFGVANVVAHSSYVNTVEDGTCIECELCLGHCPFDALSLTTSFQIDQERCVGCGVCVQHCPEEALKLVLREEAQTPPETIKEWGLLRASQRGLDLRDVL